MNTNRFYDSDCTEYSETVEFYPGMSMSPGEGVNSGRWIEATGDDTVPEGSK